MLSTLCIGHRGAKGHLPENTLPSFEYAINAGCDWVELDVYAIEGELLVIHDESVERTTNGKGLVSELSFEEIRALDAGNGHRIPTLQEVINLVDRRCRINVELKGPATAKPVSDLLSRYCLAEWTHGDFLLSSFDHRELGLADPAYPRGALFAELSPEMWDRAEKLDAWSVNFNKKDVRRSLVKEAHSRGYKVLVYTVNSKSDILKMIKHGVDGLFSDYPDRVVALRAGSRE
ncbi:MAG: glycerophosphodiester phosphodiesterase [Candidatus Azotimanducaceae bacterium WSBS_2022_MAG_OTU7]